MRAHESEEREKLIFKSLARLLECQPTEIELQGKDLVEAFPGYGESQKYLSKKPY